METRMETKIKKESKTNSYTTTTGKQFLIKMSNTQEKYTPHWIYRLPSDFVADCLESMKADTSQTYTKDAFWQFMYNCVNNTVGKTLKPYDSYDFTATKKEWKEVAQQPQTATQDLINGVGVVQTQNMAVADTSDGLVELFRSSLTKKEQKDKKVMTTQEIQSEIENSTLTPEQKALLYDNFVKPALELKAKKQAESKPELNFFGV